MNLRTILVLFSSVLFYADATYTTKYDNIDIDEVIKNERLVKRYVECLLDKGACPPDGFELKKNMPDAIATNCASCSEKQKQGSERFIAFLIDEKPEYWIPLQEKYDPSGEYTRRYLESKNVKKAEDSSNDNSGNQNGNNDGETNNNDKQADNSNNQVDNNKQVGNNKKQVDNNDNQTDNNDDQSNDNSDSDDQT